MAFVRSKQVDGKTYYQLVKNERIAGKHHQRVLMHLGHHANVEVAIEAWATRAQTLRSEAGQIRERRYGGSLRVKELEGQADALEEKAERLRSLSGD